MEVGCLLDAYPLWVLADYLPRTGARGTATSIYIKDPEGNTIELRHY